MGINPYNYDREYDCKAVKDILSWFYQVDQKLQQQASFNLSDVSSLDECSKIKLQQLL